MGIWKTIKEAFGTSTPPDARRLSAVDELALSASIKALPIGERGWITLSEARALFSPMDDQYAFGEMDEVGKMISPRLQRRATIDPISILCPSRGGSTSPEKPIASHPDMEDLPFKIVRMQTLRAN